MEIADLNLIADFEAGIKCLQNPSLISKLPKLYSFWTFTALILAVFATFTNTFNKLKLFIHHIRLRFLVSCNNSLPQQIFDHDDFDYDFDFSSDDGDDDTPESEDEDDDTPESEDEDGDNINAVFRAEGCGYLGNDDEGYNGNLTLRRRNGFSWSDFSAGKSVVQLWDSFGLGLDFEDDDESEYGSRIAIWDLDRDLKLSSGKRCQVPAASVSENVVLTAEMNGGNGGVGVGVGFGTYDCRIDGESPAIYAAWRPRRREILFDGDGERVKEE